jgi:optic atrophy 3 protein
MAPLPLFKLGALLFKEAVKPIASYLKSEAKEHPKMKEVAILAGRRWELVTQRFEHFVKAPRGAIFQSKPINEVQALSVGADLIAQSFLLTIALGLVMVEYTRGIRAKEAEDALKKNQKIQRQALKEERLRRIEVALERLANRLDALEIESKSNFMHQSIHSSRRVESSLSQNKDWSSWFGGILR